MRVSASVSPTQRHYFMMLPFTFASSAEPEQLQPPSSLSNRQKVAGVTPLLLSLLLFKTTKEKKSVQIFFFRDFKSSSARAQTRVVLLLSLKTVVVRVEGFFYFFQ